MSIATDAVKGSLSPAEKVARNEVTGADRAGRVGAAAEGPQFGSAGRDRSVGVEKAPNIEVIRAEIVDSVRAANEQLAHRGRSLEIGVDPSTGSVVVKVSDSKTGEVVRQIPSEEMLRVARNIEVLTGILVDHKE
ncbi:MAG: flagellar protein FlaG [Actinobacteria bacterium]|jgi:flagellar protein FlaG|nr:flagellar protein FlaG [Actinomycetota bacterium]